MLSFRWCPYLATKRPPSTVPRFWQRETATSTSTLLSTTRTTLSGPCISGPSIRWSQCNLALHTAMVIIIWRHYCLWLRFHAEIFLSFLIFTELMYLFDLPASFSPNDQSISELMCDLWLNFAKFGYYIKTFCFHWLYHRILSLIKFFLFPETPLHLRMRDMKTGPHITAWLSHLWSSIWRLRCSMDIVTLGVPMGLNGTKKK